ncbi:hypothetical protein Q3G72_005618 [Acer saccharum]|nr:hypothetical protein Q3G72_005618 [Acer saccharum]
MCLGLAIGLGYWAWENFWSWTLHFKGPNKTKNFQLLEGSKGVVELSVLAHASIGVIRSSKDMFKEAVDGKSLVQKDGSKVRGLSVTSSVWCVFGCWLHGLSLGVFCAFAGLCLFCLVWLLCFGFVELMWFWFPAIVWFVSVFWYVP